MVNVFGGGIGDDIFLAGGGEGGFGELEIDDVFGLGGGGKEGGGGGETSRSEYGLGFGGGRRFFPGFWLT